MQNQDDIFDDVATHDERLSCLFCDSVVNITDCLTTKALCTDNDEVCDLMLSAAGEKRATVACAQCCDSPVRNSTQIPCNGYLCEQEPKPAGSTCGVCDQVGDPKDCSVDQQCQPTEVCKVNTKFTGGVIKHELGCEQKTMCDVLLKEYKSSHTTPATGRRADHGDLVLCSACCDTLSCNKKNARKLLKLKYVMIQLFVVEKDNKGLLAHAFCFSSTLYNKSVLNLILTFLASKPIGTTLLKILKRKMTKTIK
ncbi:unnamed protein product [Mytilus edulis]|uniref:Uncharacterized protein n=1 Tax=Mytilus edulis TaxID=6550 RepID=A0A8S3R535_MYTED|nr:unnamed protein product [Mytilus edulis]